MKSVMIVGGSHKDKWPDDSVESDVWSMNGLYTLRDHVAYPAPIHTWFQIHRPVDLEKESATQLEWLRQEHSFPVYMNRRMNAYPSSIAIPVEEIREIWPGPGEMSVASSFSWCVATAILRGYSEIKLFGVHMASKREVYMEAPNLMLWCGIAAGRGIHVEFLDGPLTQVWNYGFEPRGIPAWAPPEVANELITDYSRNTRRWRSMYAYLTYYRETRPNKVVTLDDIETEEDMASFFVDLVPAEDVSYVVNDQTDKGGD